MKNIAIIILGICTIFFSGCVKNNPDPSWIEVNKWTLLDNPDAISPAGELTQNFTDAWVYIDNKVIGVFEVPFKIPILQSGNVEIRIYPVVKNNGISATKKVYPFVEPFILNTTLVQNQTLTINPTTRYYSNTKFYIEDFEDAAIKIVEDLNYSAATIHVANDPNILTSQNGNFYGEVLLNNTTDTTWVALTDFQSIGGANLPKNKDVYLEIDFYNTNSVVTGLLAISPTSTKKNQNIQLNAQDPSTVKWKKIYIDLKELITASDPQAYFEHTFEAAIAEGKTDGFIILDNIKVVLF